MQSAMDAADNQNVNDVISSRLLNILASGHNCQCTVSERTNPDGLSERLQVGDMVGLTERENMRIQRDRTFSDGVF
jgi:hypothetical protein